MGCSSSKGAAAPAGKEDANAESAPETKARQQSSEKVGPLRKHFLEDYRKGLDLADGEYSIQSAAGGEQVYLHKPSGLSTWMRALDFSPASASPSQLQVLFHYVTEDQFSRICRNIASDSLLSMLEDAHGLFGRGVYCSNQEASDMGSQEKVTQHVGAFCLDDWEITNYCIPVIGVHRDCLDLRRHQLEQMTQGPGKNIHGKPMPENVEVWVFKSAGGPNAAMKNFKSNCDGRIRLEICERKEKLGVDHPHTVASLNSLVALLRSQGKLAEAERLSSGSADDVKRPQKESAPVADPKASKPTPVAPAAGSERAASTGGLEDGMADMAAIQRAAMAVAAATSGREVPKGASTAPQEMRAPAAKKKATPSAKKKVEPPPPPPPPLPEAESAIAADQCMSLDDLMSECTSVGGGPGGPASEIENGNHGINEADFLGNADHFADIGELDKKLQWKSVTRQGG